MRSKLIPVVSLFFIGLAFGAILGRSWTGALADAVLSLAALVTLMLIAGQLFFSAWKRSQRMPRVSPPETLTARTPTVIRRHLAFSRLAGKWVLQLQDIGRIQSIEISYTLPQKRVALLRPSAPPLSSILQQAIIESPWRAVAVVVASGLTVFLLQQLRTLPLDANFAGATFIWALASALFVLAVAPPRPRP
ncbi:MAG: hypothetical protein KGJ80_12690, partial [Chloroflexota bacterium]|nr:hypothetical protein [Chloroflexota bacterium]